MIQLKINSYTKEETYILRSAMYEAFRYVGSKYPCRTKAHDDIISAINFLDKKIYWEDFELPVEKQIH